MHVGAEMRSRARCRPVFNRALIGGGGGRERERRGGEIDIESIERKCLYTYKCNKLYEFYGKRKKGII